MNDFVDARDVFVVVDDGDDDDDDNVDDTFAEKV